MRSSTLVRASLLLASMVAVAAVAPAQQGEGPPVVPTLGVDAGTRLLHAPELELEIVDASQTAAALRPTGMADFDFIPGDRLAQRAGDGYFHLGDLTLRVRVAGGGEWREASTADVRRPVQELPATGAVLAAADLAPTLPADLPVGIVRSWEVVDGHLALRFELRNDGDDAVQIGGLGIPMVFNNILADRSLDEAHAVASFHDPYIGNDAGYLQVTRLSGHGPALVIVPLGDTPFEAWRPLLSDPTRRGVTFEGFYEWMPHSAAWAEREWREAEPWNEPSSARLEPGERRSWGVRFLVAETLRDIEPTLLENGRPVAIGVPGTVLPTDLDARLFLRHDADVASMAVQPAGALSWTAAGTTQAGSRAYSVRGQTPGRARLTVTWADGIEQTIHYKVIAPQAEVVDAFGRFLTTEQWFEDPDDPFGRSPSVISYDHDERRQVTEDNRAWIAGLSDEGGAGSWLGAVMKQLLRPDPEQLAKLQRFVDEVVWGGLQYAEGERAYGVRKSLFFWEPEEMPAGTYSDEVEYGGWSSWDREEAESVVRSYDYPHVAALHWVLYRLARNHQGLVTNHPWDWYLERAWRTGVAMAELAPRYAQFGQMEGTVFVRILEDLRREGWTGQAETFEATMRERADLWRSLAYPYGSEMPWDSTGQEEVYAWSRHFGYDEKAEVTLNAILAYMPTLPHWGYNGSARRYWDFLYAGKLRRIERQLHHYGSGLNAIPVLTEYRDRAGDLYLLRVGYGGVLGAIANITPEGFGPSGFHAYPSTLRIDGYSGDYGPNFLGHALNAATYLTRDADLGWLAFGGNLELDGNTVRLLPRDAGRSRVYLTPLGLWLTLDAGTFESVEIEGETVRLRLSPATAHTPVARLRVEQPGSDRPSVTPTGRHPEERGAYVVELGEAPTVVTLAPAR